MHSNAYMNCLSPPLLFPSCGDKIIKKWTFGPTSLPSGKRMGSYREFMMLPESKHHCSKVDRVHGLWALCGLCAKKIICRFERSYTVAHWNDHEKTPEHNNHIRRLDEITELDLKKKALGETLTSLEATPIFQCHGIKEGCFQESECRESNNACREGSHSLCRCFGGLCFYTFNEEGAYYLRRNHARLPPSH